MRRVCSSPALHRHSSLVYFSFYMILLVNASTSLVSKVTVGVIEGAIFGRNIAFCLLAKMELSGLALLSTTSDSSFTLVDRIGRPVYTAFA